MALYLRPTSLDQALAALAGQQMAVLAGGTDHYPARVGQPLDEDVLDISALAGLRGIEERDAHFRIGALTTWSDLLRVDLPPWFDALKLAAREVGGVQIQNAGTIGGNLCNASPAADGVPPLLAMDAEVELRSAAGIERLPLANFILGNRRTARRPDQLLGAILVPKARTLRAASHFLKLGARRYLVISVVMAAVSLEVEHDRIAKARVAIGACSPVAARLPAAEAALQCARCRDDPAARLRPEHLDGLAPIDDVRASAAYRSDAAFMVLRRCVAELAARL